MRKAQLTGVLAGAASLLLAATGASAADYVVGVKAGIPNGFDAKVKAAGGTLTQSFPFGVAIVSSDAPGFAEKIGKVAGVQFAVEDVGFDVERNQPQVVMDMDAGFPPNSGDDDFFFDLQWGHNYVGAQEAWNNGHRGQGVVVAVLDGGYDLNHPDLAPNIVGWADMTGQGIDYATTCPGDPFSHGTHVAGTIAAADNAFGTIGVAPEAGLLLVKVLQETESCSGSGSFADIISGIAYATENGAHVINMSLGAAIPRIGNKGDNRFISDLQNAVTRAINYAHTNGTTVVVSAGNAATDMDGGDRSTVQFNAGLSKAVGISALAPENWAGNGGNVPLDPAGYTNYGTSGVDFGAPGGDFDYPGNELCTVAGITRPCWVLDFVFSTGYGTWYWSVGTSMASPHAAGVAALIISETGDSTPSHVISEMRARATDEGKPGRDDVYGFGIANSGN
jgi:subtilisin family serine protease